MKKCLPLVLLCMLAVSGRAQADPVLYTAVLTGGAENPPNASAGIGFTLVGYDPVARTLEVLGGFTNLTTPTVAAHIHCCVEPPGNVGVASPVPSLPGFPHGVTSGVFSTLLDLTNASSFNPGFLASAGGTTLAAELALAEGLALGQAYFNIHTAQFPGGEIRGFFAPAPAPIPEPATVLLVGGAAGALACARRRRRQHRRT